MITADDLRATTAEALARRAETARKRAEEALPVTLQACALAARYGYARFETIDVDEPTTDVLVLLLRDLGLTADVQAVPGRPYRWLRVSW